MSPLTFWIILGIILIVGEIFTDTFFLLCLAVGAFGISIIEFFVKSSWEGYFVSAAFFWEISLFVIISIIFMLWLPKLLKKGPKIETSLDAMIGKQGSIHEKSGVLMFTFEGQDWRIANESEFKNSDIATIQGFEGAKVVLKK